MAAPASSGSRFIATWNVQLPDFSVALLGARLAPDGTRLDPVARDISGTNAPQTSTGSLTWDGSAWRPLWKTSNLIRMARISDAGAGVLDPGGFVVPDTDLGPMSATTSGGTQLAWSRFESNDFNVHSRFVSGAGASGPVVDVSTSAPRQTRSDIASTGNGHGVVFRSDTAHASRILMHTYEMLCLQTSYV